MSAVDDALVKKLCGRRYSAADVLATAPATQARLTNLHQKTELALCSESAGQGRARQYCLIDVYQIHLFTTLLRMTGDAIWSAEALNLLLFEDMEMEALGKEMKDTGASGLGGVIGTILRKDWGPNTGEFKDAICDDIKKAPPLYWKRDVFKPVFIYVNIDSFYQGPGALQIVDTSDRQVKSEFLHGFGALQSIGAASIVNVTKRLSNVDEILEARLAERDSS